MINKSRLIKLTQKLISIDSQNPPGDEYEIARFVQGYLKDLGLKAKIYEFKPRRSNVVACLPGGGDQSLLITPHLDTVPAGKSWKEEPLIGRIKQGKLYGLGATDCKVNLAVALEVIKSLVEDNTRLEYDLIFAATADEESGSDLGLIPLLDKGILKPNAAVVLDSDEFEIIVTQKGLIHLKVKIKGRRAHGAYPWRGKNAIDIAVNILREVKLMKFQNVKNKYLRPSTINIGTIQGGDKVNVVADWCEFELDFRFLPGMSPQNILESLKKIIRNYSKSFKIEIEGIQQPYCLELTHSLVKQLTKAIRSFKKSAVIKGSEGATVITFFQDKNIPALATGFGSRGCAHVADEYVKVDNLYKGARILEEFLKNYRF